MSSSTENFITFLGENRDVILTHRGKRYKAKHIEEILYTNYSFDHGICNHCGDAGKFRSFVANAKHIYFFVHAWQRPGYNDSRYEINSFETLEELGKYLRSNKQHKEVARNLHMGSDSSVSGEESGSF